MCRWKVCCRGDLGLHLVRCGTLFIIGGSFELLDVRHRPLQCCWGFGLLLLCHWQVPPHDGRLELCQLSRRQILRVHLPRLVLNLPSRQGIGGGSDGLHHLCLWDLRVGSCFVIVLELPCRPISELQRPVQLLGMSRRLFLWRRGVWGLVLLGWYVCRCERGFVHVLQRRHLPGVDRPEFVRKRPRGPLRSINLQVGHLGVPCRTVLGCGRFGLHGVCRSAVPANSWCELVCGLPRQQLLPEHWALHVLRLRCGQGLVSGFF